MVVCTQPTVSSGISARVTEVMALSPSLFSKRYRSSYETPSSSASPASSLTLPIRKRYREDEGPDSESKEAASKGQQQRAVPVENTATDEPLGLGYRAARPRVLELAEGPTPMTTPTTTIVVDEDEFLKVGAQLELHVSILHDHTQRLDALPPTLFKGYGKDFTQLFARSEAVRDEIHSQRQTDTQRAALWQARYEDQREILTLRMQHAAD
ncbi:hypothetical protein Tco_1456108 [Tanacetum coccineum]